MVLYICHAILSLVDTEKAEDIHQHVMPILTHYHIDAPEGTHICVTMSLKVITAVQKIIQKTTQKIICTATNISNALNSSKKQFMVVKSLYLYGEEMVKRRNVATAKNVRTNGSQSAHQVSL